MHNRVTAGILALLGLFMNAGAFGQSGYPSLQLKAYERITLNGVAPSVEIKVGGEEIPAANLPVSIDYYIYLIAHKVSNMELNQVWIKKQLYAANLMKVISKPVVLKGNGKQTDTLVNFVNDDVWQIIIKEKDMTGTKPKKDIGQKVANNDLVIRVNAKNKAIYTRTVKSITQLKPLAGM
jgi:hypothetical protein